MVLKDKVELLSLELGCDRGAAGAVRTAIGRLEHLGWIAGDVMLVASELITNIVVRTGIDARRRVTVELTETADALTVSARDPVGSRLPAVPGDDTPQMEVGLGLLVVNTLARQWGTDHDDGYRVWAELAKRSAG